MRAAWLPTTARQVVGAKWRREVPPPRRLTAREQYLPWAIFSFPWHPLRVNHLAAHILAAGAACSRAVSAGSCPNGPRLGTVVWPANTPLGDGGAGMPVNATGRPHRAKNAVATRPDAIAAANNRARLAPSLSPSPSRHPPTTSRCQPWPRQSHLPPPTRPPRPLPLPRASAQTRFPKNPPACPAIGRAATSSSPPRRDRLNSTSVPAAVVRRYDASDSVKPDSASDAGAALDRNAALIAGHLPLLHSCRHVLRTRHSDDYRSNTPKDRGGSGWAGCSGPPFPLSATGPL
jgi:hypothetical protein